MADARFEDGQDKPVRIIAHDPDDLPVLSALIQDGLVRVEDISWMKGRRRVALKIARFRWEDHDRAQKSKRPYERVQSLLIVDDVLGFRSQGVAAGDRDIVLSILALHHEPGPDAGGVLTLTLAGDGALAFDVDCVEVRLQDVSRPYEARSAHAPDHLLED